MDVFKNLTLINIHVTLLVLGPHGFKIQVFLYLSSISPHHHKSFFHCTIFFTYCNHFKCELFILLALFFFLFCTFLFIFLSFLPFFPFHLLCFLFYSQFFFVVSVVNMTLWLLQLHDSLATFTVMFCCFFHGKYLWHHMLFCYIHLGRLDPQLSNSNNRCYNKLWGNFFCVFEKSSI